MKRIEFILMKAIDELDEYGVIAVDTYMALTDAGYDADYVAATISTLLAMRTT